MFMQFRILNSRSSTVAQYRQQLLVGRDAEVEARGARGGGRRYLRTGEQQIGPRIRRGDAGGHGRHGPARQEDRVLEFHERVVQHALGEIVPHLLERGRDRHFARRQGIGPLAEQ